MRKDSSYYEQSIKVLEGSTLFKGVCKDMLDDVLKNFIPITLPKKSIIYYKTTKDFIFIILQGRVKLSKINPQNGREYIISILDSGDIFDIISLLDNKEHEINIEAIDELQLLKTSTKTARGWLDKNPDFNKNFLPYIGKRMLSLENAGSNLALYDTITRLTKLILDNVDMTNKKEKEFPLKLINDLSHETLSQMIGSVRKVTNLNIQELKKDGTITSTRGKLSISNMQKLLDRCKNII